MRGKTDCMRRSGEQLLTDLHTIAGTFLFSFIPQILSTAAMLALLAILPSCFAQTIIAAPAGYQFAPVAQHSLQRTAACRNPILELVSPRSRLRELSRVLPHRPTPPTLIGLA